MVSEGGGVLGGTGDGERGGGGFRRYRSRSRGVGVLGSGVLIGDGIGVVGVEWNWVEKEWGWMVGEIHKSGWLQSLWWMGI